MSPPRCPDDNRLVEYVEGLLSPRELLAIDQHVDGCVPCREVLAQFALGSRGAEPEIFSGAPVLEGEFAGRYEIASVLGTGAMAIVYAAHDRVLDRRIALKLLRESDPERTTSLAAEARAMAKLTHPNVVPVYDIGTIDGRMFLTAELIEGQTVAQWLEAPRSWRQVVEVFVQAGRGLAAAHAAEITHRDFKPSNLLIGQDGRVRITDFGLARRTINQPAAGVTGMRASGAVGPGTLIGTPAYMAPEQLRGEVADSRSDQFAFCVSLYEALHGARPFHATSIASLLRAIETRALAPASRPVPAAITALVERGLALDPGDRAPAMAELVRDLADALVAPPRETTSPKRATRSSAVVVAVAIGCVAVVAIGGLGSRAHAPGDATSVLPTVEPTVAVSRPAAPTDAMVPATAVAIAPPPQRSAAATGSAPASGHGPGLGSYVRPDVGVYVPTARPDAAVASAPVVLHPIPIADHPALLALIATLGHGGVTFDGPVTEQDLAELRGRIDQLGDDARTTAVQLEFALGAAQRQRAGCASAWRSFEHAHEVARKIYATVPTDRPLDRRLLLWDRRAQFAVALCELTTTWDAARAMEVSHHTIFYTSDFMDGRLLVGVLLYETGDPSGSRMYLDAGRNGGAAVRTALTAWANAVGAPLSE